MIKTHVAYLRQLPAVDEVLRDAETQPWITEFPRATITSVIRHVLESIRQVVLQASDTAKLDALEMGRAAILERVYQQLTDVQGYRLRRVINATGVIIHTNLGRSLLAPEAVANMQTVAESYSNLEYDLERGVRGSRYAHIEVQLTQLTGAEAALVVNNNAAAVFLALQALAVGREVIVSRGQLIEIGGSFRIPDIMRSSGAILREVGATNKTHLHDYAGAICEQTALLLRVHTSNYRIVGFTAEVAPQALVTLGHAHDIPVMEDLGSGTLVDLRMYGVADEPTVPEVIASGVDLVTFSGDKLLGGPQAGILVGKASYIEQIRRHPLHRAVRVDKFTIAALEATLKFYAEPELARQRIPTLSMLSMTPQTIRRRLTRLRRRLPEAVREAYQMQVVDGHSAVGGGALPLAALPTKLLALQPTFCSLTELERRLRGRQPAIIGRIVQNQYCLDLRTVREPELAEIATALQQLVAAL
ncbi:MAG: L-seryl-tRNA(Sec) selenium transferase [bacterium]|nr:L-seryl-tRNA(Sec) selenium transferase [bacterium]